MAAGQQLRIANVVCKSLRLAIRSCQTSPYIYHGDLFVARLVFTPQQHKLAHCRRDQFIMDCADICPARWAKEKEKTHSSAFCVRCGSAKLPIKRADMRSPCIYTGPCWALWIQLVAEPSRLLLLFCFCSGRRAENVCRFPFTATWIGHAVQGTLAHSTREGETAGHQGTGKRGRICDTCQERPPVYDSRDTRRWAKENDGEPAIVIFKAIITS